ncbi:MAG: nucleotidyltransferase domain-containing protein [Endomicrobia bacterium]|nr:nucleotidyltransferase domain-containing protein [Endomicrobiia bacterium]MDW8055172.1 nucleotidyltransferase domain-containing protein [Elusimicrobiota bacterium]
MRYFDLLIRKKQERDKYLHNLEFYLDEIRRIVKNNFEDAKIFLFGSYVKGNLSPKSDIDILIVIKEELDIRQKSEIILNIKQKIGLTSPFEFHIASYKEYQSWWKNFIKDNYKEIVPMSDAGSEST